jgi:hypothetical protein
MNRKGKHLKKMALFNITCVQLRPTICDIVQRKVKKSVKIKIEATERQGKLESKKDKVFTINCVYKEVYDEILGLTYIRNILPPIEHIKISEINKNFSTQDLNATEEYYFDESDVGTEEYYGEMSFQRRLL